MQVIKRHVELEVLVPSQSVEGASYSVKYNSTLEDGVWSCTCPAFKHGKGEYCKHIEEVRQERVRRII